MEWDAIWQGHSCVPTNIILDRGPGLRVTGRVGDRCHPLPDCFGRCSCVKHVKPVPPKWTYGRCRVDAFYFILVPVPTGWGELGSELLVRSDAARCLITLAFIPVLTSIGVMQPSAPPPHHFLSSGPPVAFSLFVEGPSASGGPRH